MICFLLDILLKTHSHMTCQNKSVHNVYKILVQITSGFSVTSWTSASWSLPKCFDIPRLNVVRFLLRCMKFIKPLRIPEVEVSGFMLGMDMFGTCSDPIRSYWIQLHRSATLKGETVGVSLGELRSFTDFSASSPRGPNSTSSINEVKYQIATTKSMDLFFQYPEDSLDTILFWCDIKCGDFIVGSCCGKYALYINIYWYIHLERVAGECWLLCIYIHIYQYNYHFYRETTWHPTGSSHRKSPPTWSLPEASVASRRQEFFNNHTHKIKIDYWTFQIIFIYCIYIYTLSFRSSIFQIIWLELKIDGFQFSYEAATIFCVYILDVIVMKLFSMNVFKLQAAGVFPVHHRCWALPVNRIPIPIVCYIVTSY